MLLQDLYDQTPRGEHDAIVVAGNQVFFDGDEYAVDAGGVLRLVRSLKGVEAKLDQILAILAGG